MKLNKLFLGAIAALASAAMVACSDDAPDINNGGENGDGGGYLAVNIVTPAAGSRATAADFENGSDDENLAEEAKFLFFDAAGNPTQTPQNVPVTWKNSSSNDNNVAYEKVSDAIVTVAGKTNPTQMLVILNPGTIRLAGLSLKAVLEKVDNYGSATKGTFIMTNSAYYENGKIVITTPLTTDNIKETPTAAEKAAVKVYVERIVAKITTENAGLSTNVKPTGITTADGEKINIVPTIEGLQIANAATNSFLFKNIDNISSWVTQWAGVTDPDNKRSYWASNYANRTFANYSWTNIDKDEKTNLTFYVQENTNITQQTSVIITASLNYTDAAGNTVPANLVKWAGNYYLKDQFLGRFATLINNAGYKIVTVNDNKVTAHRTFSSTDIRYITNEEHAALVQAGTIRAFQSAGKLSVTLNDNQKFAKNVTTTGTGDNQTITYEDATETEINDFLLGEANLVWLWSGKSYYYVPIKHFGPKSADNVTPAYDFSKGVIRNHIYKLSLKGLEGLGTPVVNPDEVIVPEKPDEKLFYVAAQMYILKWRIVSQEVNFTD